MSSFIRGKMQKLVFEVMLYKFIYVSLNVRRENASL